MKEQYRIIPLENGDYIQVKYDEEAVIFDKFNKDDDLIEIIGYDEYNEVLPEHISKEL